MHRKADEGGLPGRNATEENAARCVPERRPTLRDFGSGALEAGSVPDSNSEVHKRFHLRMDVRAVGRLVVGG